MNTKREIKEARKFMTKNLSKAVYIAQNYVNFWNWTSDQPDDDSIEVGKEWDRNYTIVTGKEPEEY